jgi:restriction system protein
MVRAGRGSELLEGFLGERLVSVGFIDADITACRDKAAIRALVLAARPSESPSQIDGAASQLHRFKNTLAKGDTVVTFDTDARVYHVGTIASDYRYVATGGKRHVRDVTWTAKVSREALTVPTRNSLGSALTLFAIEGDARSELLAQTTTTAPPVPQPQQAMAQDFQAYFEETERRAAELIADAFTAISPEMMPTVVAALMRVTGYHVRLGAAGADRGVDLYASPDPWMVRSPRVKVQVKHRQAAMGGPELRNFIGTLQDGDTGIYVSTGGFTKDARYEAERSSRPVSLVDRAELIALFLEHYDKLDDDVRSLVPVKRVYLPVRGSGE